MQERLLDVCEDVDAMTGKYLFEKEQEAAMGTMVRAVVSTNDLNSVANITTRTEQDSAGWRWSSTIARFQ